MYVLVVGFELVCRVPRSCGLEMSWTIDPLQADDSRALSKGVSDVAGARAACCTSLVGPGVLHEADPQRHGG